MTGGSAVERLFSLSFTPTSMRDSGILGKMVPASAKFKSRRILGTVFGVAKPVAVEQHVAVTTRRCTSLFGIMFCSVDG